MNNIKIAAKLIIGFSVVIVFSIIVGVIGVVGMYRINKADSDLYNYNLLAISYLGTINAELNNQRMLIRQFVVYDAQSSEFSSAQSAINSSDRELISVLDLYKNTIIEDADLSLYNNFRNMYTNDWANIKNDVLQSSQSGGFEAARDALTRHGMLGDEMMVMLSQMTTMNVEYSANQIKSNDGLFVTMLIFSIAITLFSITTAAVLGLRISRLISIPIKFLSRYLGELASTGNLELIKKYKVESDKFSANRDETGEAVKAVNDFIGLVQEQGDVLRRIADKDLSEDVVMHSNECTIDVIASNMLDQLNDVMSNIQDSAALVSSGSKQVSDGAQSLAQGSTEQAAAVQQLLSSINEVSNKTKENADKAQKAADLADSIQNSAAKGSTQMDNLMQAVEDINKASRNINNIIKVIDDIAFQTDILALNATVEAARAGKEGRGFLVVADEVRKLATQSAEAAKDTGELIANSMEKAQVGAKIARETVESLSEIVSGIKQSGTMVSEIAQSSTEQSVAISQINTGIGQVAQVVQQNSSTSQESAAAAEEMASQSDVLAKLAAQFKLKNKRHNYSQPRGQAATPAAYGGGNSKELFTLPQPQDNLSLENFGKY